MSYAAALRRTATRSAKIALARGLIWTGQTRRARGARDAQLAILMYHGVLPAVQGPAAYGDLFVSTGDFARHLRHLNRHYHVLSLRDVVSAMATEAPLPPRAVAVTFDDGYQNVLTAALPVLTSLRVPATVFVPSDLIGGDRYLWFDALRLLVRQAYLQRRRFDLGSTVHVDGLAPFLQEQHFLALNVRILALPATERAGVRREIQRVSDAEGLSGRFPEFALASWEELRSAVAGGVLSVGSHALAHGDLTALTYDEQVQDLRASRERIERELGQRCESIAYPYGRWNDDSVSAVQAAGYDCAVTAENGFNRLGDHLCRLKRIMAGDKGNLAILSARLSGGWDKLRNARP